MKVYITYDRYEHNEWFNIDYVSTDRDESITHFTEVDLPNFISYGPDDCHSYQLQEVEMTDNQYGQFMKWIEEEQSLDGSSDLYNFMVDLFDCSGVVGDTSVIMSTDGCSDNYDIVDFYGQMKGLDISDWDIRSDLETELFNDDDLYQEVLKQYIECNY